MSKQPISKNIQPLYKALIPQTLNTDFEKAYEFMKSSDLLTIQQNLDNANNKTYYINNNSLCFAILENEIIIEETQKWKLIELIKLKSQKSNIYLIKNIHKQTLLHVACIKNLKFIVDKLINENIIDKAIIDDKDKTCAEYFIESNTYECDEQNDFFNDYNAIIKNTKPIEFKKELQIKSMKELIDHLDNIKLDDEIIIFIKKLVSNKKGFEPHKFFDIYNQTTNEIIKIRTLEKDVDAKETVIYSEALQNFKKLYSDFKINEIITVDEIEKKINEHDEKINDTRDKIINKINDNTDLVKSIEDLEIEFFNVPVANAYIYKAIIDSIDTTFIDWLKINEDFDCLKMYDECINCMKNNKFDIFKDDNGYTEYNNLVRYYDMHTNATITNGYSTIINLQKFDSVVANGYDNETKLYLYKYILDYTNNAKDYENSIKSHINETMKTYTTDDILKDLPTTINSFKQNIKNHYIHPDVAEKFFNEIKKKLQIGGTSKYVLTKIFKGGKKISKDELIKKICNSTISTFGDNFTDEDYEDYVVNVHGIIEHGISEQVNDEEKKNEDYEDYEVNVHDIIENESVSNESNEHQSQIGGNIKKEAYPVYNFNNFLIRTIKNNINSSTNLKNIIIEANKFYYSPQKPPSDINDCFYVLSKPVNEQDENKKKIDLFLCLNNEEESFDINKRQLSDFEYRNFENYEMYYKNIIQKGFKTILLFLKQSKEYSYIYDNINYEIMTDMLNLKDDEQKKYTIDDKIQESINLFKITKLSCNDNLNNLYDNFTTDIPVCDPDNSMELVINNIKDKKKLNLYLSYYTNISFLQYTKKEEKEEKKQKGGENAMIIIPKETKIDFNKKNFKYSFIQTEIKEIIDLLKNDYNFDNPLDFNISQSVILFENCLKIISLLKILKNNIDNTKLKKNKLFEYNYIWLEKYQPLNIIYEKINEDIQNNYLQMDEVIFNKIYEKIKTKILYISSLVKENNKLMSLIFLKKYNSDEEVKNEDNFFTNDFSFNDELPTKFKYYDINKYYIPSISPFNYNEIITNESKYDLKDTFSSGYILYKRGMDVNILKKKYEKEKLFYDKFNEIEIQNDASYKKYNLSLPLKVEVMDNIYNMLSFVQLFLNIHLHKMFEKLEDFDLQMDIKTYDLDDSLIDMIEDSYKLEIFKKYFNIQIQNLIQVECINIMDTCFNAKFKINTPDYKKKYESLEKSIRIKTNFVDVKDNITENKITSSKCFNNKDFENIFNKLYDDKILYKISKLIINLKNYKLFKIISSKFNEKSKIETEKYLFSLIKIECEKYLDMNIIFENISNSVVVSVNETSEQNKLESVFCKNLVQKLINEFNNFIIDAINCCDDIREQKYKTPLIKTKDASNYINNLKYNYDIKNKNKCPEVPNMYNVEDDKTKKSEEKYEPQTIFITIQHLGNQEEFDKNYYILFKMIEKNVYEDYIDLDKYENSDYNITHHNIIEILKKAIKIIREKMNKDITEIIDKNTAIKPKIILPPNLNIVMDKYLYDSVVEELNIKYPDILYETSYKIVSDVLYEIIPVEEANARSIIKNYCDFYANVCKLLCSNIYNFITDYLESLHNLFIYLNMLMLLNGGDDKEIECKKVVKSAKTFDKDEETDDNKNKRRKDKKEKKKKRKEEEEIERLEKIKLLEEKKKLKEEEKERLKKEEEERLKKKEERLKKEEEEREQKKTDSTQNESVEKLDHEELINEISENLNNTPTNSIFNSSVIYEKSDNLNTFFNTLPDDKKKYLIPLFFKENEVVGDYKEMVNYLNKNENKSFKDKCLFIFNANEKNYDGTPGNWTGTAQIANKDNYNLIFGIMTGTLEQTIKEEDDDDDDNNFMFYTGGFKKLTDKIYFTNRSNKLSTYTDSQSCSVSNLLDIFFTKLIEKIKNKKYIFYSASNNLNNNNIYDIGTSQFNLGIDVKNYISKKFSELMNQNNITYLYPRQL
jgi:hypothetical protein